MYEAYFGLDERPFELTPNPRFLYMTAPHREALTTLEYGLSGRTGIAVLIGEAGTGKTTLVHAALHSQNTRQSLAVYLNNPSLTRDEFVEFLAAGFGLSADAARSKTRCLYELTEVLAKRHQARHMSALVIDEAQCLPDVLLEEIRLLANIESASEKLLSIILAGQPELADRLNQTSLRQLKQRVGLRCALRPLRHDETTAYIAARIGVAGGKTERIFTREAIDTVHECAGGIPRTISVICDNALVTAFALDRRPVDTDVVLEVCRDFDFMPEGASYDKTG
ncbi:MAG TPA: AAA family ATPase [Vicinamibacterales bacterium]|nr:AAA family ATPase [Vicinamibacterales bacterium]